jgi:hypothetical protein
MTTGPEISDVVEKTVRESSTTLDCSRVFYETLTQREKSLINICYRRYNGDYEFMIRRLRHRHKTLTKRSPHRAGRIGQDIGSLEKIYDFWQNNRVDLYKFGSD